MSAKQQPSPYGDMIGGVPLRSPDIAALARRQLDHAERADQLAACVAAVDALKRAVRQGHVTWADVEAMVKEGIK